MLSWLYPGICELCGERSETSLCPDCLAGLPRLPRPICLYCGAALSAAGEDPMHCPECTGKPRSFRFARQSLLLTEQTMGLIHKLKYQHANHLAVALAPLLSELWEANPPLRAHDDWVLVPVPADRQHLFARGYNQAEELARALGKLRGLRVLNILQRRNVDGHASQTQLSAAQRQAHAFASFSARSRYAKGKSALPPHLLLVDDVFTTGATARACARALRELPGVKEVGVITLLRVD